MATVYKKNARNVFVEPIYRKLWLYIVIIVSMSSMATGLYLLIHVGFIVVLILWLLVAILLACKLCLSYQRFKKSTSFRNYLDEISLERAVTKSLLATMSVNRLQDSPYIEVPSVAIRVSEAQHVTVQIEKLAGMYDIEKLVEDVNASFKNKFSSYAVTSSIIAENGLYYRLILENIGDDKTWRPTTLEELKQESHLLKLQENLVINLADTPHVVVWGKSGSGKTTLLFSLIAQLLSYDADLRIIDGKSEFSSFKEFYPSEKIVDEKDSILQVLDEVCSEIKVRQKIVADEVTRRQKMGLRAYDMGLKPIVVLADEIGSIIASLDTNQKKKFISSLTQIVQKGRSVSVFAIVGTQHASVDILPAAIRGQFGTKVLLGSANGDLQRMAFDGDVATKGDVERFQGYFISDGITNQPLKFFVTDLHAHSLNDLDTFKKLYKKS